MRSKLPLDMEERPPQKSPLQERLLYLEIIPPVLIAIGLYFKYLGKSFWLDWVAFGGGLAVVIYLFFSWFLFKVDQYRWLELIFSILTGLTFTLGMVGLVLFALSVDNAFSLIELALNAVWPLSLLSIGLLLVNIRNERASRFYRRIIARLMVFAAILLTILVGIS
ncbi:MAG: hypothetical protein AAFP19_08035 [Bacteroidota bacterium]